jgi:Replication-relaxation
MRGNRGRVGLILQPRDQHLLSELRTLRVVDREQARRVASFASVRRTNARLLLLTRAGFLRRSFIGSVGAGRRALYRLPSDRARTSPAFLAHQLALNDVYLRMKGADAEGVRLQVWRTFAQPVASSIPLVPDAYAEVSGEGIYQSLFIEVDRGTESGRVWREKARLYKRLAFSGEFERTFGQWRFRVAVLTTSSRRVEHIRRAVAEETDKLFWFSTFDILSGDSFFGPAWLRPDGCEKVSLL